MIDFNNASFVKLSNANPQDAAKLLDGIMLRGETVLMAFKGIRDWVVFTSHRVVAVNVQGMTGKKRDFTSLPYGHIQAYSVETAGHFDLDSELEMWFSGLGKVKLEFSNGVDIRAIGQLIASHIL
ncbi:PH domain-containing protein [Bifidobacterium vansinderenii]|uniref:Bacterial PH domain-containing protein n=1 Tax=Bifidobacterium vansinderenii TaxID=1984871 RepID=A0A229VXQ7_9BIFI|nr:PH domain-containing protein [Bifidobacterium vansinderenii]OXN00382.1 Bacterial PH domain-containing protein [Bifidobacterium vansinderenii]